MISALAPADGSALFFNGRFTERIFGAALLASTMIGAMFTHFFLLSTGFGGAGFPAGFLVLIVTAVRRQFSDRAGAQPLDLR